jgi:TonB family protein
MTATALQLDIEKGRPRQRACMVVSVGVHVLIAMWIVMAPHAAGPLETLTEITLLEPGDPAAGAPAPAAVAAALVPHPGVTRRAPEDESFRRQRATSDLEPSPQTDLALQDKLNARLNALRTGPQTPGAALAAAPAPSALWSSPAGVPSSVGTGGGAPVALARGGGSGGPSIALTRGSAPGGSASLTAATVKTPVSEAARPATSSASEARRTLAGATLMGPVADRPVVQSTTPIYPDWAQREGAEGSVTLYFIVRPDGSIKENILVQKTAGFEDFDENARAALRAWRFAALPRGQTGDQWGTITFHFRLRSAG